MLEINKLSYTRRDCNGCMFIFIGKCVFVNCRLSHSEAAAGCGVVFFIVHVRPEISAKVPVQCFVHNHSRIWYIICICTRVLYTYIWLISRGTNHEQMNNTFVIIRAMRTRNHVPNNSYNIIEYGVHVLCVLSEFVCVRSSVHCFSQKYE